MEAKIKPQDLRIGNLVYDKYGEQFGIITVLTKDRVFLSVNGGDLETDYDSISPIALSEDILKRMQPISWLSKDVGGYFYWFNGEKKYLKYLHSLQNIFKEVEGSELTIKDINIEG